MKTKLVFWGTNEKEERVLIGLSLRASDNMIDIYAFPEEKVTDTFYDQMMEEWRMGKEVEFPEGTQRSERTLNSSESLLPDNLKASRTDLVQRAQTEWHFVVLSEKLHQNYEQELEELRDRVNKLESFDKKSWESLKEFWNRVQTQARDRTLFWEHANKLREHVNELFGKLKEMRSKLDEEFREKSKANMDRFGTIMEDMESRIADGSRLRKVFDDLKNMQKEFWELELTREHRQKLRKRINNAFKTVKEKRFGQGPAADQNAVERISRRYEGLIAAIDKMKRSVERDRKDLQFQEKRIADTQGQLEAQIRQAKIKMIQERLQSKEAKLTEMNQTRTQLEDRVKKIKEREAKQKETAAARAAVKEKIAEEIKQRNEETDQEKLEEAAEKLKGKEEEPLAATTDQEQKETPPEEEPAQKAEQEDKPKESLIDAIGTTLGEALEDVIDTVKAVAEVVGDKLEEKVEDLKEKVEDLKDQVQDEEE